MRPDESERRMIHRSIFNCRAIVTLPIPLRDLGLRVLVNLIAWGDAGGLCLQHADANQEQTENKLRATLEQLENRLGATREQSSYRLRAKLEKILTHLLNSGTLELVEVSGITHYRLRNWRKYQSLNNFSSSRQTELKSRENEPESKRIEDESKRIEDEDGHRAPRAKAPEVDWQAHLEAWNLLATKFSRPTITSLNPTRKTKLRSRLAEHPDLWQCLEVAFSKLGDFARGESWLTFDWILSPTNLAKLLEGNYSREHEGKINGQTNWLKPGLFKEYLSCSENGAKKT